MAGNVLPVIRTLLRLPPAAALTVATDVASRSPAALLRAAGEVLALDGDPGIGAEPPVPTMVMWGARDAVVPIGGAGWVGRALPGAEPAIIPDAGHMPMLDGPAEVVRVLRDVLG